MDEIRPFKRLTVENHFAVLTRNRILVAWALNPAFAEPGPYSYTLQRAHAADADAWTDVSKTVDQPWLYDNYPELAAIDRSTFYRVVLVDGLNHTYISQPVETDMSWDHYDWRRMREIVRKETLALRLAGTDGWLLKRRIWGDPCTCINSAGQVTNSNCPDCYGTTVMGGYYQPQEYKVIMNPAQRLKRLTGDEGLVTTVIETCRALAWPAPVENDIWVAARSNRRFRINSDIAIPARWRDVDIVYDLRLTELPLTDVVYTFPTPGFP